MDQLTTLQLHISNTTGIEKPLTVATKVIPVRPKARWLQRHELPSSGLGRRRLVLARPCRRYSGATMASSDQIRLRWCCSAAARSSTCTRRRPKAEGRRPKALQACGWFAPASRASYRRPPTAATKIAPVARANQAAILRLQPQLLVPIAQPRRLVPLGRRQVINHLLSTAFQPAPQNRATFMGSHTVDRQSPV